MKNVFGLTVIILFFLQTSVYAKNLGGIDSLEKDSLRFELMELRYGKIITQKIASIANNNSPSGLSSFTGNYRFTEITDTISAKLNVTFGVELKISANKNAIIPLNVVWKFPSAITNYSNRSFHQESQVYSAFSNGLLQYSYTFDYDYEIKPGVWELEIYNKGKLLYTRQFYIMFEI